MPPYRPPKGRVAWHQRVDARLAIGVTLIAGIALAAVLGAAGRIITTNAIERADNDLQVARQAFTHLVERRVAFAAAQTRLVTELPTFRATTAIDPHDAIRQRTIDEAVSEQCGKLNATFCVVTNNSGAWTGRSGAVPSDPSAIAAIGRTTTIAQSGTGASDIIAAADDIYLVVSEPILATRDDLVGTLTVAYPIDSAFARELSLVTHSEVTFICGKLICGTSLGTSDETMLARQLAANPEALGTVNARPERRWLNNTWYVSAVYELRSDDTVGPRLALLQDWTPTETATTQLYAVLSGIGAAALAVALMAGFAFSRRLTRPLRELASAADEIAGGNRGRTVASRGPIETRTLAEAFNHMASSIAHWHEEAENRARRLGETYERFRSVSDSVNDAILSANTQGNILFWNKQAQAIFGYSEEEAIGRPLAELFPERHREALATALIRVDAAGDRRPEALELDGVRRDGSEVPIELSLSTWMVESARCYTAVIRDITERRRSADALKQRDEELRQAQKMEAVGRLAGGVAHDFNNLLTAILGYADLLLDRLPATDPNRRQIGEIQKAGRSAASLTRGLLAFSRKQVLQPVVLNLNAVVSNSEDLLRRLIGEDVELVIALEPSIASVKADPAQIEQLLVNLSVNARDAMPAGGKLTIATVNLDEATTRLHAPTATGPSAALVVRDTGVGMTDDVRAHIFEPFFTTKGPGHGTGLGLASVYGAVKQSGGHVWVESEPGKGSTFTICLPAVAALPARPSFERAENPRLYRGTETILLVEDNDAVREMARETLIGFGYDVIEAANGKEALKMASQALDRISLVLTDVVMPLMGGAELAVRLRTMRPDMKFIFASGYASDPVPGPPASSPGASFLQKPFSPSTLGKTVRRVLDAGVAVAS